MAATRPTVQVEGHRVGVLDLDAPNPPGVSFGYETAAASFPLLLISAYAGSIFLTSTVKRSGDVISHVFAAVWESCARRL